jgi:hypothetical protein
MRMIDLFSTSAPYAGGEGEERHIINNEDVAGTGKGDGEQDK